MSEKYQRNVQFSSGLNDSWHTEMYRQCQYKRKSVEVLKRQMKNHIYILFNRRRKEHLKKCYCMSVILFNSVHLHTFRIATKKRTKFKRKVDKYHNCVNYIFIFFFYISIFQMNSNYFVEIIYRHPLIVLKIHSFSFWNID